MKRNTAINTAAPSDSTRYVYGWGAGKADGNGGMKALLGGKGAMLAEMTRIGLPVPPGFTITTEVCTYYYAHKRTYPAALDAQLKASVAAMEKIMDCKFGDASGMPLLVAVRSGARDSMPGMMDTILNLGLNDQTVLALAKATNNERFAWDCYRRFVQMYGDVVLGVQRREGEDHEPFEVVIEKFKHDKYHAYIEDSKLTADDQKELVKRFKLLVKDRTKHSFPSDPWDQLRGAAGAVFGSWMNDLAIFYRRKYKIPADWGTAVQVQAMVYGSTGESSGSGVTFTRNPVDGANELYGEFLINAQVEDVVAGVRTPEPVSELKKQMPKIYAELMKVRQILEKHFKNMMDVEFIIQDGKLFILQTRNGKCTVAAALKFSMDMYKEKLIDCETAVLRIPRRDMYQLFLPVIKTDAAKPIAIGFGFSPGAVSGKAYFDLDRAKAAITSGERVILVASGYNRIMDLIALYQVNGILMISSVYYGDLAFFAEFFKKPCVCHANVTKINYGKAEFTVGRKKIKEGTLISIDGATGTVCEGHVVEPSEIVAGIHLDDRAAQQSEKYLNFMQLMKLCRAVMETTGQSNQEIALDLSHHSQEALIDQLLQAQKAIREKQAPKR